MDGAGGLCECALCCVCAVYVCLSWEVSQWIQVLFCLASIYGKIEFRVRISVAVTSISARCLHIMYSIPRYSD